MKTKKIAFIQQTYVIEELNAKVDISVEDFKKLESGKMGMGTILKKYPDIEYVNREIVSECDTESVKYMGEVRVMMPIEDKKFLIYLRSMINDYEFDMGEETDVLEYIVKTKKLEIFSVRAVYSILKTRELDIDIAEKWEEEHCFRLINKQHAYIKCFIERYFEIEDMGSTPEYIRCNITWKKSQN